MEGKEQKLPTSCTMLQTRLAMAECSRRSQVSDNLSGSALTLSANVSGYHYLQAGSLQAEAKSWMDTTDSLLLANIFSYSNHCFHVLNDFWHTYGFGDKRCVEATLKGQ